MIEACGAASKSDLAGSNDVRRCRDETKARNTADREQLVELESRAVPIVFAARCTGLDLQRRPLAVRARRARDMDGGGAMIDSQDDWCLMA